MASGHTLFPKKSPSPLAILKIHIISQLKSYTQESIVFHKDRANRIIKDIETAKSISNIHAIIVTQMNLLISSPKLSPEGKPLPKEQSSSEEPSLPGVIVSDPKIARWYNQPLKSNLPDSFCETIHKIFLTIITSNLYIATLPGIKERELQAIKNTVISQLQHSQIQPTRIATLNRHISICKNILILHDIIATQLNLCRPNKDFYFPYRANIVFELNISTKECSRWYTQAPWFGKEKFYDTLMLAYVLIINSPLYKEQVVSITGLAIHTEEKEEKPALSVMSPK